MVEFTTDMAFQGDLNNLVNHQIINGNLTKIVFNII